MGRVPSDSGAHIRCQSVSADILKGFAAIIRVPHSDFSSAAQLAVVRTSEIQIGRNDQIGKPENLRKSEIFEVEKSNFFIFPNSTPDVSPVFLCLLRLQKRHRYDSAISFSMRNMLAKSKLWTIPKGVSF